MAAEGEGGAEIDGRGGNARQRRRSLLGVRVKLLTGRFVGSFCSWDTLAQLQSVIHP